MNSVYTDILTAHTNGEKLLAVLLDPDKLKVEDLAEVLQKINNSKATHVFVGGSIVANGKTDALVKEMKQHTSLPIILFPGNVNQVTPAADALLFLSLISGNNPEYLIGQQVKSIPSLLQTELELIATGYVLVEGGVVTAVQQVSQTKPIAQDATEQIVHTALAGQYLGMKMVYIEAGSGAKTPVDVKNIRAVAKTVTVPLIVGGGIRSGFQLQQAYEAGATMAVVGTAFEEDVLFFEKNNVEW